jgi:serine/threonine protein kinase
LLNPGTKLDVYEVVGALGAGGMGEVYRARDTKLGREVALKVLPEALAADAERIGRFQREAKVLASLNHPNIASIYGFEDSGGVHAQVMELVEGQTLAERIGGAGATGSGTAGAGLKAGATGGGRPAAMPVDEALPVAKQICERVDGTASVCAGRPAIPDGEASRAGDRDHGAGTRCGAELVSRTPRGGAGAAMTGTAGKRVATFSFVSSM